MSEIVGMGVEFFGPAPILLLRAGRATWSSRREVYTTHRVDTPESTPTSEAVTLPALAQRRRLWPPAPPPRVVDDEVTG